jgi:hypothetical protein
MDITALLQSMDAGELTAEQICALLSPEALESLILRLKHNADQACTQLQGFESGLRSAEWICSLGRASQNDQYCALGAIARANIYKDHHSLDLSKQALDSATALYAKSNDRYGWARTRITALGLALAGPELFANERDHLLQDISEARAIFASRRDYIMLARLLANAGPVHFAFTGDNTTAIAFLEDCLALLDQAEIDQQAMLSLRIAALVNLGNRRFALGQIQQASQAYNQALDCIGM